MRRIRLNEMLRRDDTEVNESIIRKNDINALYENIMLSVSKIVKNALNEADYSSVDHSHNSPAHKIKKEILWHYINQKNACKGMLVNKSSKTITGEQVDLKIRNCHMKEYDKEKFGIYVIIRRKVNEGTCRLAIERTENNVLNDPQIDYFAFAMPNPPEADNEQTYDVFVLSKEQVLDVYNNILDAKEQRLQSTSRKTVSAKNCVDQYGNRFAPLQQTDGIVFKDDFIINNAIDSFLISYYKGTRMTDY